MYYDPTVVPWICHNPPYITHKKENNKTVQMPNERKMTYSKCFQYSCNALPYLTAYHLFLPTLNINFFIEHTDFFISLYQLDASEEKIKHYCLQLLQCRL